MIQNFAVRYGAPMANRIIKARAGSNFKHRMLIRLRLKRPAGGVFRLVVTQKALV